MLAQVLNFTKRVIIDASEQVVIDVSKGVEADVGEGVADVNKGVIIDVSKGAIIDVRERSYNRRRCRKCSNKCRACILQLGTIIFSFSSTR